MSGNASHPLPCFIHVSCLVNRYGFSSSTNHPISQYLSYSNLSGPYQAFLSHIDSISIPRSVSEALQNPNWTQAMKVEMEALQQNKTWELVSLPPGEKTVGCKWVFTVKYRADGSIDRYKARLVVKMLYSDSRERFQRYGCSGS